MSGTLTWTYDFNIGTLVAGTHTIRARSVDMDDETSQVVELQFLVEETKKKKDDDTPGFTAPVMLLAALGVAMLLLRVKGRQRR